MLFRSKPVIVIYGDSNNWFAAWGAWVFDIYGVKNVKLLDGGRKKWEAEKRPLTPLATQVAVGNIKVSDANNNLRARLIDVVAVANKKSDTALVDIRSNDEFTGKVFAPAGVQELAVRAGHIPGAVSSIFCNRLSPRNIYCSWNMTRPNC